MSATAGRSSFRSSGTTKASAIAEASIPACSSVDAGENWPRMRRISQRPNAVNRHAPHSGGHGVEASRRTTANRLSRTIVASAVIAIV